MDYPVLDRRINHQQFSAVARRLTNMGLRLPDHIVNEGKEWYPTVHETVARQSRGIGLTTSQGAGVVAAVSPNMDFGARNIKALDEIHGLEESDWKMIYRSARSGKERNSDVAAMLREKAPSLNSSYDANLVKAHRIMRGEDFRTVLDRRTAPKTHSFAHNILEPETEGYITVDGRHADIIANARRDWKQSRGISSANLQRGTSRYENYEDVTRLAHSRLLKEDPRFAGTRGHDVQAILWLAGRAIERRGDPARINNPNSRGDKRVGQPYVISHGRPYGFDWQY